MKMTVITRNDIFGQNEGHDLDLVFQRLVGMVLVNNISVLCSRPRVSYYYFGIFKLFFYKNKATYQPLKHQIKVMTFIPK
jgi:hypothetical protein